MPQGNGGVVGPANDPTTSTASGVWGLKEHAEAVGAGEWPAYIAPLEISRSLRFNSADSAYLSRTPASAGNRKTWTWSGWVKRGSLGGSQQLFHAQVPAADDTSYFSFRFMSGNEIGVVLYSYYPLISTPVYRDVSGWYHIMCVLDTTQASASDRLKIYINGAEVTAWGTDNRASIAQNAELAVNRASPHAIGAIQGFVEYFNGLMAEVHFVDGQALTPSDFGQTNSTTGVWQPKTYTGSYGTNGFYLPFSDNSSADSFGIGNDASASGLNRIESGNTTSGFTVLGTMTFTGLGASPNHLRDNNPTTSAADGAGLTVNTAMGYDFGQAVAVRKIKTITEATNYGSTYDVVFNIQYSDDNSTWTTITGATTTHPVTSGLNKTNETSFDDNGAHRYWRLMYSSSSNLGQNIWISTLDMFANDIGPNSWWPNNFSVTAGAGNDSLVDTPTPYGTDTGAGGEVRGNYCTLNPLNNLSGRITLTNGNLDAAGSGGADWESTYGTISVSSGKWYFEGTVTSAGDGQEVIGVVDIAETGSLTGSIVGYSSNSYGYYSTSGNKLNNSGSTAYGATYGINDVIGVALDLDAGTLTFYKNGSTQGQAFSGISGTFVAGISTVTNAWSMNFGQRPFAYTAPSGFKALVTTNLPEPTVLQGDDYFNTVLWTGNGTGNRSITGVGFQPDFLWVKARNQALKHTLYDGVRGSGKSLTSSDTGAEVSNDAEGYINSFDSDGFGTLNGGTSNERFNASGYTYAAWNWNAGGSNATNTDGTITSTVRANPTAGFSIVSYTGTGPGSAANEIEVGHGLGVAPKLVIVKSRSSSANWFVFTTVIDGTNDFLYLNTTDAVGNSGNNVPTSSVFYAGGSLNTNTYNYIAYCFAEVPGFSAFGKYTGNGSATNGTFVYTGFRPRWIMLKNTTSSQATGGGWIMIDTARNPINNCANYLIAEGSNTEGVTTVLDALSNGFKTTNDYTSTNGSGLLYVYAAFAENPFKYSLAR